MPNTITPEELAALHLPRLERSLQLTRAGAIRPNSARDSCEAVLTEVSPCVLYCEVVDGCAMKFGTAGSLVNRQRDFNERTINNILAARDGRYKGSNRKILDSSTYDKYKRMAPEVIRSGKKIEIWAVSLSSSTNCQHPLKKLDARCNACKDCEGDLNDRYKTIQHGWASRRN